MFLKTDFFSFQIFQTVVHQMVIEVQGDEYLSGIEFKSV